MKALITGSGGLIGSECARFLLARGWLVVGVDNNLRAWFFGADASTEAVIQDLLKHPKYEHHSCDIRDRAAMACIVEHIRPDFIVHAAAQPSHDKAASIAFDDFDVNAGGTMNMLMAARDFCPESPFCFTSTSKVYGDNPNRIPMVEKETRYDYADRDGISEDFPIDGCLHSIFGASKVAADVMCQEFGRYFGMPVGIFRGACLTGAHHAAVPLHGYLAYIVACAVEGREYTVHGYNAKQVRDQIDARDVAALFFEFYQHPRPGEVYNMGGGRPNSISIRETIWKLSEMGFKLNWKYSDTPRIGDHVCYISDISKVKAHFPGWQLKHGLDGILEDIAARYVNESRAVAV